MDGKLPDRRRPDVRRRRRALLIEWQAWFVARDLGRLVSRQVPVRSSVSSTDQRRHEHLVGMQDAERLISESVPHTLLIGCYHWKPQPVAVIDSRRNAGAARVT